MSLSPHRLALIAAGALLVGAPCLSGLCNGTAAAQEKAGEEEAKEARVEEKVEGTVYHFGTATQRTNILFESETTVETIHGITHSVEGSAAFDFDGGRGKVELSVPVADLRTGLEKRDEHMRAEDWLHAEKFPDIVFKAKSLKRTKSDEKTKKETWAWEGSFTLRGVTKELSGEATVQRIPAELGKKLGRGEWLKVKTSFQVTLADFGIQVPEVAAAKVSPTWDVTVDIFGTTAAPK